MERRTHNAVDKWTLRRMVATESENGILENREKVKMPSQIENHNGGPKHESSEGKNNQVWGGNMAVGGKGEGGGGSSNLAKWGAFYHISLLSILAIVRINLAYYYPNILLNA